VYTDDGVYADELREVFGRTWRLACHESELPGRFDYRCFEHAGQSLFCIRGADGAVRTFVNACSHRGARLLAEPSGNAARIVCFYHLWTYDAAGACVGIPRPDAYEASGAARGDLGLRAVRTEVRLGLVFVNLDDGAPPLGEYLGNALAPFDEILGAAPLEVFHYARATLDCNWKAWQETNLDLYHESMHVVLRKTQLNAMPMADRRMLLHPNGHAGSANLKAAYEGYDGFRGRGADVPSLPGTTATDFRFVVLFPNSAVLSRGTVVRIDTVTPLSSGRSLLEMRGLGQLGEPEAHRQVRVQHHNQYWGPFGRNVPEDMFAAEECARSFRGGAARWQLIAREEGGTGQDDAMLRAFYAEWGRRVGRSASDPLRSATG
jgi:methanesulfonate monooxygenase large subunit